MRMGVVSIQDAFANVQDSVTGSVVAEKATTVVQSILETLGGFANFIPDPTDISLTHPMGSTRTRSRRRSVN